MDIVLICLTALVASLLTFFSGFGLGTILTPVFILFFPIEVAIALTAVVHFINNIFKFTLIGKHVEIKVLMKFGLTAIIGSAIGSIILINISDLSPLFSYQLFGNQHQVLPVNFVIGILLFFFSLVDLIPYFKKFQFGEDKLVIGGILSGFIGGISGQQGAMRSAFLIKLGLPKEKYIATGIAIACLIDITRISVYSTKILHAGLNENISLIVLATGSAMIGALIGNKLLHKVTLKFIQIFVAIFLLVLSIALMSGFI